MAPGARSDAYATRLGPTEAEFQWDLIRAARQMGYRAYHTHDSRRSDPGFPDLVLVRERVVFAEVKNRVGRVSPAQAAWRESLERAGAEYYLWRPEDFAEALGILARRLR